MAIIQTIRDKYAKVAGGVVVLALVGFIVGGTDVRSFFVDNETVAKINGEKISINEFDKALNNYKQQYKVNNQLSALDNETDARIAAQSWDQFINEKLMGDIYDKLGIIVSSKEMDDMVEGDFIDPQLANQFMDQQTGQINRVALQQSLEQFRNDPKTAGQWEMFQSDLKNRRLQTKFVNMVAGSIYVPKYLAEAEQAAKGSVAAVKFVNLPYNLIPDAEVKATDEELLAYMKENSKLFEQKTDSRAIEYVSFDIAPTPQDSAEALNALVDIKDSFVAATSEEALRDMISLNSSTQSVPNYYKREQLNAIPNAEEIWNATPNTLIGPFIANNTYMIAKTTEKRSFPDSVKYRHIVVVESNQGSAVRSDAEAKSKMDSAIVALNAGSPFDSVSTMYSDDQGMLQSGGSYELILAQKPAVHQEFGDFVFNGKPGEKKLIKVTEGAFVGYQYVEILSQSTPVPVVKLAFIDKELLRSKEAHSIAYNAASSFISKAKDAKTFDATAMEMGKPAMPVANIEKNNQMINGVGVSKELSKWVYAAKVGDVSNVFTIGEKYIVVVLKDAQEKGKVELTDATRQSAEFMVMRQKKAKKLAEKNNGQTSLDAIASANNQMVQEAADVNLGQPFNQAIGNEPRVIGFAFNAGLGQQKMSKGITGNNGVFYIEVLNKTIAPAAPIQANEKRMMEMQLKNQVTSQVINGLKDKAEIEDKRDMFY